MKIKTKKEGFAYFGIKQTNERWSWSGVSEDGKTVALTIWTDQKSYNKDNKSYTTSTFNCNNALWKDDQGNKGRIDHIKHCKAELNGKFRAIFVTPKDPGVIDVKREIVGIKPMGNIWFQITEFDEETGEFESKSIP